MASTYARIYAWVAKIPRGKVATYGQLACLAGIPRNARQVGYAMAVIPEELAAPWHRVINSKGEISWREHPDAREEQRALLEREGVAFDESGRVPLKRYLWSPK
ncbi:MAG: methylated-DNA--[protein]-cysteine S-methyltransferase [Elusimicrobia bacterium]|nr:methylated-DNA--[protein]-cysteine S-methyltransferase [Elusimicrobiota bacterium]